MSVDLPEPVVWLLNFIGVYWPDIDEDAVRELAGQVRQFGDDLLNGHNTATDTISTTGTTYQGAGYEALAVSWSTASTSHMDTMVNACETCALGLEATATTIEIAKAAAAAQLAVLASTVAASQAAAVATLGLSEAAAAAAVSLSRWTVRWLEMQLVGYITGELILAAVGPLEVQVQAAVNGLVYKELSKVAGVNSSTAVSMDPDEVSAQAQTMDSWSGEVEQRGQAFVTKAQAMSFG